MPNAFDRFDVPLPPRRPSVLDQAKGEYPALKDLDIGYVENPREGSGFLEYWPAGEPGSPDRPRPQGLHPDKPGLEIYRKDTRPIDILGDVVSHQLIESDPKIKGYYDQFRASLTGEQQGILREQYQHAQREEGETRPFGQWMEKSGLPAYFRGYAFQQWPTEATDKMYTPQQRAMFDDMMGHLKGAPLNYEDRAIGIEGGAKADKMSMGLTGDHITSEADPHRQLYPVPPWTDPGPAMEIKTPLPPDQNTIEPDAIMPLLHQRQRGDNPLPEQVRAQPNPFDAYDPATSARS